MTWWSRITHTAVTFIKSLNTIVSCAHCNKNARLRKALLAFAISSANGFATDRYWRHCLFHTYRVLLDRQHFLRIRCRIAWSIVWSHTPTHRSVLSFCRFWPQPWFTEQFFPSCLQNAEFVLEQVEIDYRMQVDNNKPADPCLILNPFSPVGLTPVFSTFWLLLSLLI